MTQVRAFRNDALVAAVASLFGIAHSVVAVASQDAAAHVHGADVDRVALGHAVGPARILG